MVDWDGDGRQCLVFYLLLKSVKSSIYVTGFHSKNIVVFLHSLLTRRARVFPWVELKQVVQLG